MVRKIFKIFAAVLLAGFVVIQFFQIDKSTPPINESETLSASVAVPADISEIIGRSCNDCHTYKTIYPWYSNIQPAAWFLDDHIRTGRQELNFSIFNTYSLKKKLKKLEEICEQVELKEMPLPSFLWLHHDAVLSESDGEALCEWAKHEIAALDSQTGE